METTIRHSAANKGLPIRLPRRWRTHLCPRANVCMSKAVLMRDGTSLITIFLVTLRRLNVRPFMRSPGIDCWIFLDRPKRPLCHQHPCADEGSRGAYTTPPKTEPWSMLVKKPAKSWLNRLRSPLTGASWGIFRSLYKHLPMQNGWGRPVMMSVEMRPARLPGFVDPG